MIIGDIEFTRCIISETYLRTLMTLSYNETLTFEVINHFLGMIGNLYGFPETINFMIEKLFLDKWIYDLLKSRV